MLNVIAVKFYCKVEDKKFYLSKIISIINNNGWWWCGVFGAMGTNNEKVKYLDQSAFLSGKWIKVVIISVYPLLYVLCMIGISNFQTNNQKVQRLDPLASSLWKMDEGVHSFCLSPIICCVCV